jgi:Ca2+/H+ antiporter, TMEM165/GDT1 family
MNPEKVVFGFFIVLALTLNFGFFVGEIDNPAHHDKWELFAVIVVNLIATVLKFGDRSQMGALLLATSLVAMLQLLAAALVWTLAVYATDAGMTPADHGRRGLPGGRGHDRQRGLGGPAGHRDLHDATLAEGRVGIRHGGPWTTSSSSSCGACARRCSPSSWCYALAVSGLVLIPGQDADGNPAAMGFFHAFYVVSYTATTIGFGELPNAFTDAQRLWMIPLIYVTVGVWIYAARHPDRPAPGQAPSSGPWPSRASPPGPAPARPLLPRLRLRRDRRRPGAGPHRPRAPARRGHRHPRSGSTSSSSRTCASTSRPCAADARRPEPGGGWPAHPLCAGVVA